MEGKLNSSKCEENDDDYEEILLYLDIEPTSLAESQIKEASALKFVGNDLKILLQVNNRFFEGDFDYSIGTHVFFEKDDETPVDPLYSQCEKFYKFVDKTNKIVKMNRVLLKEKTENVVAATDGECDAEETLKLTRTYEEALNLFLPPGKSAPRKITREEDIKKEFILKSAKVEQNE